MIVQDRTGRGCFSPASGVRRSMLHLDFLGDLPFGGNSPDSVYYSVVKRWAEEPGLRARP